MTLCAPATMRSCEQTRGQLGVAGVARCGRGGAGSPLGVVRERAREVLDARVPPGDTVPVHTHCWPSVQYILSFADFVRRDAAGEVVLDCRSLDLATEGPRVLWSEPIPPHTLENVGDRLIHAIVVELKEHSSL